jgi:hypothetical protein
MTINSVTVNPNRTVKDFLTMEDAVNVHMVSRAAAGGVVGVGVIVVGGGTVSHCHHNDDPHHRHGAAEDLLIRPHHHRQQQQPKVEGMIKRRIRYYECTVTISVFVYWLFVSLIPIYNKFFFKKQFFPYPIATAGIQLFAVSILLGLVNILQHYWYVFLRHKQQNTQRIERGKRTASNKQPDERKVTFNETTATASESDHSDDDDDKNNTTSIATSTTTTTSQQQRQRRDYQQRSWIFGPYLLWKLKWCFPIGFLFGVKYGVTNLGLHLVPAPIHLLLQATDLVWTVLGAWWINGERVNWTESACLVGCVAGSVCLGWQIMLSHKQEEQQSGGGGGENGSIGSGGGGGATPLYAIGINLISPMLLGLCISTLRLACTELMRHDNRVGGTVSAVELTAIKLSMSSAVALILACFIEGGTAGQSVSWWTAFANLSISTKSGVLGGSVLISVFQANCTFLTCLTSAVTVGLVGQVKIIPQWILATVFSVMTNNNGGGGTTSRLIVLHPTALFGAFLICGSAAVFAYDNYRELINIANLIEHIQAPRSNGDDEETDHDDNNGDDIDDIDDGGSSAFQALTQKLSRRRSSSAGGSVVMLSTHSLQIALDGEKIKPLLLVTDADLWGEASMRETYDEFEEGEARLSGQFRIGHTPVETPLLNNQQNQGSRSKTSRRMNYNSLGCKKEVMET